MTLRHWVIGIQSFEAPCCPHVTEEWNPRQHRCSNLKTCLALMFMSWLLHYDTLQRDRCFQFLVSAYQTAQFGCSPLWNTSEYPPVVLDRATLPGLAPVALMSNQISCRHAPFYHFHPKERNKILFYILIRSVV